MTDRERAAEVLGRRLSNGEARPLENQAKRHYRAAGRNLARFAADLRRLQDGEAHLTRGFSSFGVYAELTFDGLSAANAKKISVQDLIEEIHELPDALAAVIASHLTDPLARDRACDPERERWLQQVRRTGRVGIRSGCAASSAVREARLLDYC